MFDKIKKVDNYKEWKDKVESLGDLIDVDETHLGVVDENDPDAEGYFAIWFWEDGFGYVDETKDEWNLMEYLRFNR